MKKFKICQVLKNKHFVFKMTSYGGKYLWRKEPDRNLKHSQGEDPWCN